MKSNKEIKILVLSDNHGQTETMDRIIKKENPDYKLHCGDYLIPKKEMEKRFDYFVLGNNDLDEGDIEIEFSIDQFKFKLLHGHTLGMDIYSHDRLLEKIQQEEYDALIFGHVHIPINKSKNDKTIFCPGSSNYPRDNNGATYGIILINDGKLNFEYKKVSNLL